MPLTLDEQSALNQWIAAKIRYEIADALLRYADREHYATDMQEAWMKLNDLAIDVPTSDTSTVPT